MRVPCPEKMSCMGRPWRQPRPRSRLWQGRLVHKQFAVPLPEKLFFIELSESSHFSRDCAAIFSRNRGGPYLSVCTMAATTALSSPCKPVR